MHEGAYCLDTETTGLIEPQVIEVAHIRLSDGLEFYQRYKPTKAISFGAMAVHGIIDNDLIDCPPTGEYLLPFDCRYIIGHKVSFDVNAIGLSEIALDNIKVIDTLPLAQMIFNDLDSYTQLACLYRINKTLARELASGAHNALKDARMNTLLFVHICQTIGTDDLDLIYELAERSRIPEKMRSGKYIGVKCIDLPKRFKEWYQDKGEADKFVIAAMNGAKHMTLDEAKEIAAKAKEQNQAGKWSISNVMELLAEK